VTTRIRPPTRRLDRLDRPGSGALRDAQPAADEGCLDLPAHRSPSGRTY